MDEFKWPDEQIYEVNGKTIRYSRSDIPASHVSALQERVERATELLKECAESLTYRPDFDAVHDLLSRIAAFTQEKQP